jgi:hypothetical protein
MPAEAADTAAAEKVATDWLRLVDGGRYEASWGTASALFHGAVPQAGWVQQIGAVRGPIGPLRSRKLKSATYATRVPGAPDGEYVVVQFDTSLANKATAVETLTPMKDPDGAWRVSGDVIK